MPIQFNKNVGVNNSFIDPVIGGVDSNVEDWLRYFQKELQTKFREATDAFRHFDIKLNGLVSFGEFKFIIDFLAIRFPNRALHQMFNAIDSDGDGKLTYQDFVALREWANAGGDKESL